MNNDNIMVDLETMGTKPFCPILSIGAVRFELGVGATMNSPDTFYQAIRLESCLELGMKVSADTLVWWMGQSAAAQAVLTDLNALPLPQALDRFTDWHNSRPDLLWGNSARFDLGLLEAAYTICGKVLPWQFYRERCYRTVKAMAPSVTLPRSGTHHNALDDAISQARHLQLVCQHLRVFKF